MKQKVRDDRGNLVGYVAEWDTIPGTWAGWWVGPCGTERVSFGDYKGAAIRAVLVRQEESVAQVAG